jgi:hypothetical protein
MFSPKLTKFVAAGAATVAIAAGGVALGNSSSGSGTSAGAGTAQAAAPAQRPPLDQKTHTGPRPQTTQTAKSGSLPKGWQPGDGTVVTGAAADQAKAVAVAKYPGTVNRVLKLSDGSYAVHLFATSGVHHVFVSTAFTITGTA